MAVAGSRHQCKPPLSKAETLPSFPSCTSLLLSQKHSLMRLLVYSCFAEISIFPRAEVHRKGPKERVSNYQEWGNTSAPWKIWRGTASPEVSSNTQLSPKLTSASSQSSQVPLLHVPLQNCTKDLISSFAKEKGAQKSKKHITAKRFQWLSLHNWYWTHVLMVEWQGL